MQRIASIDGRPIVPNPATDLDNGVGGGAVPSLYAFSDWVAASTARVGQRSWVNGTIMRMEKPSRR